MEIEYYEIVEELSDGRVVAQWHCDGMIYTGTGIINDDDNFEMTDEEADDIRGAFDV